jgi:hypothetical protein
MALKPCRRPPLYKPPTGWKYRCSKQVQPTADLLMRQWPDHIRVRSTLTFSGHSDLLWTDRVVVSLVGTSCQVGHSIYDLLEDSDLHGGELTLSIVTCTRREAHVQALTTSPMAEGGISARDIS